MERGRRWGPAGELASPESDTAPLPNTHTFTHRHVRHTWHPHLPLWMTAVGLLTISKCHVICAVRTMRILSSLARRGV